MQEKTKQDALNRIARMNGQVNGIKKMIEEQLKGLKLEGDQQEQLKQRIEEMKARIDEMKKKLHEQHPGFRGGAFDGPEPIPGALPAGGNAST